jgi:succinate-semialdehyde dehydrogenase
MPDTHVASPEAAISRNPAIGEVIERFPFQSDAEIEQILLDATAAFQVWRAMPMQARAKIYTEFAKLLHARANLIAPVITAEMGKTLPEAVAEVEKCASTAQWFAEHGPDPLADEPVAVEGGARVYVTYLPIGRVLGIMPWNFSPVAGHPRLRADHDVRQCVHPEAGLQHNALRLHKFEPAYSGRGRQEQRLRS